MTHYSIIGRRTYWFVRYLYPDLKSDNVLVVPNCPNDVLATTIDAYLREHPPSIYEPLHIPELSSKPIVTVASQPLPNFGLSRDLGNLSVKLVDFGTGEYIRSVHSSLRSFSLSTGNHFLHRIIEKLGSRAKTRL